MSHSLTLILPDEVYNPWAQAAQNAGTSPEVVGAQWLTTLIRHLASDPLEAFIGAFSSNIPDWTDQHDFYLGEHLSQELMGFTPKGTSNLHFEQAGFMRLLK